MRLHGLAALGLLVGFASVQEIPKDTVRKKLKDTDVHASWIYDDLPAAFAEAKKTGKPVLALLRCVP